MAMFFAQMKYSTQILFYFQKLKTRVRLGRNKGLFRVANQLRRETKRSIRRRQGASQPFSPPHAHTEGGGGLRAIMFAVDIAAGAAIVGPVKFPNSNFFDEPVPFMHEFGGTFSSKFGDSYYPQRSYMHYTLRKLVSSGQLPREFAYGMGQII